MTCPSCGRELPAEFPFCPYCGAALGAAPSREERKLVTVLFADLVGFTARAERLDPEDVRALLAPYHSHLRAEVERFGGTAEKFIGDAVMALFGAPVAHEDDPERAVRAALAIRDWALEQGPELQVRIAVNTGEALVVLGARPSEGESMAAGDVVNTASRLQSSAPLNGVLVGEQTQRATAYAIEYREAAPVSAKGKADPVRTWEAVRARSSFGVDVSRRATGPFVGRARELELLESTLARVREERAPQLVTLVGVPGIGKSRLVTELFRTVDEQVELIRWRQGRSLPYGEGVTFWALAEIVKAEAGILESDTAAQAEDKLEDAVARVAADEGETTWLLRQLRPLAGLAEETPSGHDEAFAGWRRYVERLAETRPLVLVFEDLHWADDALLEFVDRLVERAAPVPLLVLGTARPELLQRRSAWGGGKPNALTVSLAPLSDGDTARLVDALLVEAALDARTQTALVARAGGNPLYAEQYARALAERGDVVELPDSVHGIIAARLDALSEAEKRLLQDAAVLGKVFWLGAIAAVDAVTRWQAEELLFALERKEFVQRSRASSVASEAEYAFRHVLIRDVAYGQIPRAERSQKHRRAAEWIESLGRPDDQAEMLAHHYVQALELGAAAGLETETLAASARRALRDAGDRAAALGAVEAAKRFYDAALALWPEGDPERAHVLFRRAAPVGQTVAGGDPERLEIARDALLAAGDRSKAAESEMMLSQSYWMHGRRDLADAHRSRAAELIEGEPPGRSVAWVLARLSARASLVGDNAGAIELASRARDVSQEIGWQGGLAEATNVRGIERVYAGDRGGLEDIVKSIELAHASGSAGVLARCLNTIAVAYQVLGEPGLGLVERLEALAVSEQVGSPSLLQWFDGVLADHHYRVGQWVEAARLADSFLAAVDAGSPNVVAYQVYAVRAELRIATGDLDGARGDAEATLLAGRGAGEVQALGYALSAAAHVFASAGATERAVVVARELLDALDHGFPMQFAAVNLPMFAAAVTRVGLGERLPAALDSHPRTVWTDIVCDYAAGDFAAAADRLQVIGATPDEAEARRRAAEQLADEGRRDEADEQLRGALAFYRSVGATAYVRECEGSLSLR